MKRKFMFAAILLLALVSLGCVSAADEIQAEDIGAIDDVQSEDVSISEDSASEDVLTDGESGSGSLYDLYYEMKDAKTDGIIEYNLTRDYAYDEYEDEYYFPYNLDLIFTDNFVLDGKGHTIDGGNARQIFEIWGVQNVTLKNINFVNAKTPITIYYSPGEPIKISNCSFVGCSAPSYGGAIYSTADLNIEHCTFVSNNAVDGGGAIYSNGIISVYDSTFSNNYIDNPSWISRGGAIYLNGSSSSIVACNFNFNRVVNRDFPGNGGGAVYVSPFVKDVLILGCQLNDNFAYSGGAIRIDGIATINHCGFGGNNAIRGGAVDNEFNVASIHNSTFDSNHADENGGAIYSFTLNLTDSRFIKNNAYGDGGAVYANNAIIINSNFTENVASSGGAIRGIRNLTLDNIYFSENTDDSGINNIHTNAATEIIVNNIDTGNQIFAEDVSYSINSGGKYSVTVKDADGNALVGENVTFSVGNKVFASSLSDANGVVAIDFTPTILKGIKAGTHNLQVLLTNLYQDKTVKLTINKDPAAITAKAASFVINYAGKYSVTIRNSGGKVLSGQKVTFVLNGKNIGSANTNANGVATITLSAKVLKAAKYGTKNLVIKLDSPLYTAASKTVKVTIKKEKTKIIAAKKSFRKALKVKKYTITLKNSKGKIIKKAKLTLKVKGKTFKATTNSKGKATFKITNLKTRGKFKASINFKTTPYYLKSSKSAILTIK